MYISATVRSNLPSLRLPLPAPSDCDLNKNNFVIILSAKSPPNETTAQNKHCLRKNQIFKLWKDEILLVSRENHLRTN